MHAYFALIERDSSGERCNVRPGVERTVRSLVERLIELAGALNVLEAIRISASPMLLGE